MSHSIPCKHLNFPIIEFAAPRANFPFGVESVDSMPFPKYTQNILLSDPDTELIRTQHTTTVPVSLRSGLFLEVKCIHISEGMVYFFILLKGGRESKKARNFFSCFFFYIEHLPF